MLQLLVFSSSTRQIPLVIHLPRETTVKSEGNECLKKSKAIWSSRACGPMLKFAFLSDGFSAPRAKKRKGARAGRGGGRRGMRRRGRTVRIMRAEWMYIFWRDYCRFSAAARAILARGDKWRPWSPIGAKTARFVSVTSASARARARPVHRGASLHIEACRSFADKNYLTPN